MTAADPAARPAEHQHQPPAPAEPAVLPEQTRDDGDLGWGGAAWREASDDERYLRERPPHWE